MSRRIGQNGSVEVRNGMYRGRYLVDVAGQIGRVRRAVILGPVKDITRSEAKRRLKDIIHREGIDCPTYVVPAAESFAQRVQRWEQTYLVKRKPSTQDTMQYHLKCYLLPRWGSTPVDMISADAVNEWIGSVSPAKPGKEQLSPNTLKGIVRTLQMAAGRKFARGTIFYPSMVSYGTGEDDGEVRCYSADEVRAMIAGELEEKYKLLFMLASETGARAGELYALKIADLDFGRNLIYIRKTMYRQSEQTPKTKNARRRVTVKPYAMKMLQRYVLKNNIVGGLVFRSRIGTPLVNTTVLDKHLHPLQERLGIPMGGMHGFRHFRVSYLVEHGVPDNIVMDWIGHGSAAMIRLYTHLRPQHYDKWSELLPEVASSTEARGQKC